MQTDITLANQSPSALDVVWFNAVDLDLNDTEDSGTGVFMAPGTILQTDEDGITRATYTSSLAPTAWEIGEAGHVQSPLDDGTLLSNLLSATSPFGPEDIEFAFQHNFSNLGAGNSVSYTTTLSLATVPEPSSVVSLVSLGVLGLVGYSWRRRKRS